MKSAGEAKLNEASTKLSHVSERGWPNKETGGPEWAVCFSSGGVAGFCFDWWLVCETLGSEVTCSMAASYCVPMANM